MNNFREHLRDQFAKEINLSDFHDIIYSMKDEFDMEFSENGINGEYNQNRNTYSLYWDKYQNKIIIRFIFLIKFYLENKEEILDALDEFESRLSEFEFNSGVKTPIGTNTPSYIKEWNKDDIEKTEKYIQQSHIFISTTYKIEARFKV